MSGDYSRDSFDARRHFSAVRMQQGRVALDADWNEQSATLDRRLRAETVDLVGRRGVPRETADAFRISITFSGEQRTLSIGRGRLYVDGLLTENHGGSDAGLDLLLPRSRGRGAAGVLGELIGRGSVTYHTQPYWPERDKPDPLQPGAGPHLVYLDVWQREVTAAEDPRLLEKALNGVDTTTRLQTVWQVRVLRDVGAGVTCATPEASLAGWNALTAPSAGRLTTSSDPEPQPDDPCLIAAAGGYRGLENQLYRIEIHDGGPPGTATFKWSRDNASVVTAVAEIMSANAVRVTSLGRDAVLGFAPGDWVEMTDDRREFNQQPGFMLRIASVDADNLLITFATGVPPELVPTGLDNDTPASRHTHLRRWDQAGLVRDADGSIVENLDAAGAAGVIRVPDSAAPQVVIEHGLRASFRVVPGNGRFRTGDSWTIPARSIDGSFEHREGAPPEAIHHHHTPLALVRFPDEVIDLRPPFNSLTGNVQVCCALYSDGDGRPRRLRPGLEIPMDQLARGFSVLIRQSVDAESVNDGTLFVTTEIPFRPPAPDSGYGSSGPVVAYQPVVLPAEVMLAGDGVLTWRPFPQSLAFLADTLRNDVARLSNVRFEAEFEVFDHGGPPSRWALGQGNTIVQTEAAAGTRPPGQPPGTPTMAVHRAHLRENAVQAGLSVDVAQTGSVGIVYNWLSQNDFSLFVCLAGYRGSYSGGGYQFLGLSHVQIRNGAPVDGTQAETTIATGFTDLRQLHFDVMQTSGGLQFRCTAVTAFAVLRSGLETFLGATQLIPGSRLGVLTGATGAARFTRLQVVYGDSPRATLIPAGLTSRLLSRLVLKRALLEVTSGPGGVPIGDAFAAPVPEADFETWFWLLRPTLAYYGSNGDGNGAAFRGIGSGRLLSGDPAAPGSGDGERDRQSPGGDDEVDTPEGTPRRPRRPAGRSGRRRQPQ